MLTGGLAAASLIALPATAAFATGCPGTSINLEPPSGNSVDGTACYTTSGSNIDVTVTLDTGTVNTVFACYAESDVNSSFTSASDCAGKTASYFAGQATPSGGLSESTNPATFTLQIVASNPTAGQMQVDPGDWVYLHIGMTNGPNGDDTSMTLQDGYQVPSPSGVPVISPPVVGGVAGVAVLGAAVIGVRRRRARAAAAS